jgi:ubiquinone/menaquinone biosynthesis C-methylase UbiE
MFDQNKIGFQNNKIIDIYSKADYLDKPEVMLLYKFWEKLKNMRMLDIGVGGGRTTFYFAPRVRSYVGIDYSEKMVEICKKRFPNLNFSQCDVRNMQIFKDDYFDLVLFSFNGIDSIDHDDRLTALREIKRVCKKSGGVFFFSSHNLNFVPYWFSFKYSLDPFITCRNLYKYILLKFKNINVDYEKGYVIINDGAHNFKFKQYYISPKEQIRQLKNVGFKDISIYKFNSGTEITNQNELQNDIDPWVHYLCES